MKQAHIFVSGFVQGVGFRQFVKKEARKLGLTGWVKNTKDNKVEAVFQGPEDKIKKIVELCKKGPFLSEVKDIRLEWIEIEQEYKNFEVIV